MTLSNQITAEEARTITNAQYKRDKNFIVQKQLDKIYSFIDRAANGGSYSVEIDYPDYGDEISKILQSIGYKVKKRTENAFGNFEEYMVISWSKS